MQAFALSVFVAYVISGLIQDSEREYSVHGTMHSLAPECSKYPSAHHSGCRSIASFNASLAVDPKRHQYLPSAVAVQVTDVERTTPQVVHARFGQRVVLDRGSPSTSGPEWQSAHITAARNQSRSGRHHASSGPPFPSRSP